MGAAATDRAFEQRGGGSGTFPRMVSANAQMSSMPSLWSMSFRKRRCSLSAVRKAAASAGMSVGIWLPAYEIASTRTYGSLLALIFAFVGAYAGICVRRAFRGMQTAEQSR
jgi:hypothetical protein